MTAVISRNASACSAKDLEESTHFITTSSGASDSSIASWSVFGER